MSRMSKQGECEADASARQHELKQRRREWALRDTERKSRSGILADISDILQDKEDTGELT